MTNFVTKMSAISHITRFCNAARVAAGYLLSSALHRRTLAGMPLSASIEPANYCNLRCPQCPTGLGILNKTPHLISLEHFKQTIDALTPELIYLNLYFQGEPTLNKELPEMVKYASRKRIYTSISTNGHFLTPDVCSKLHDAGLGKLIVSLDGATEESYRKYRIGGDFNKVLDGIANAVKAGLKVELQCLLLSSTENEMEQVKALGKSLNVWKVTFKTAQFYSASPLMPTQNNNSRYHQGTLTIKHKLRNRCWRLFSGVVITTEGEVLPCCYDKDSAHSYGNMFKAEITKDALRGILRSQRASSFINSVFRSRMCNAICTNCTE